MKSRHPEYRHLEPAELARLRKAWSEGVPEYILQSRHRLGVLRIKKECAGLPRPVRAKRKRQAPAGFEGWSP